MENLRNIISLLALFLPLLLPAQAATCDRERCCNLDTCTDLYCQQKNSETWISTQSFENYQFTKLVLDENQCKPCPNNCKSCSSPSTCSTCYSGYFLSGGTCLLCDYKCLECTQVNQIKKCSQCDEGTYLDDTTLTCKSCPVGAKVCSSQTTIVSCQTGYRKSSNSLFCTACPENCLACPISDAYCSQCSTGYYASSGTCNQCGISNCQTCIGAGLNVYCTQCSSGYLVGAGQCYSCPSHCQTCSSTNNCVTCEPGYYVIGGGCSSTSSTIANCDEYSSSTECSSCSTGYYLSDTGSQCLPCSILCSSCYGSHFGRCTACQDTANIFNQMCLVDPFPSSTKYRMYVSLPADIDDLQGGTLGCSSLLYSGTEISLSLDNLYGFKIELEYKLLTEVAGQQYSLFLNNNSEVLSSSSEGYELCNSTKLYLHVENEVSFSEVALQNTLTFRSDSGLMLHLAQILITVFKCNSLCLECSESECFQCLNDKLYTQDAYCVYVCGNGYYTYELAKQCVSDCPIGTYALITNASCMECSSPCYTCLSETYCLSCEEGYFLTEDNTCEQECPYRFYGSEKTQKCEQCVGRCNECISDEQCLSCQIGFLQETSCVDDCQQSGYFEDLQTLKCSQCSSQCAECDYEADYCLSCSNGLVFFNNTCLDDCPQGYFSDGTTCIACTYPCQTCINSSTNCLSCVDSYLHDSDCVSPCIDGYYENNIDLECQACSASCTICYSSSENCLECSSGYYWIDYSCTSTCPEGYYEDSYGNGLGICSPCEGLCKDCQNQTYCLSCQSNFLNSEGNCVRSSLCPEGQFAEIQTLQCTPCDSSCLTCQYSASTCTSCQNGLILYNNQCVQSCPSQYFYNSSSTCTLCQDPCLTCLDETQCLSCVEGYKYSSSNNVCSSTCSVGTFFNSSINDCSECSSDCLTCDTSTFCYLCDQGFYIRVISDSQNQCVSSCPEGYYSDSLSCMQCLYPCKTCTSTIDCLTCQYGIQYQYRCLSGCPDSTYRSGETCLQCGGNCLTCKDTATTCVSCNLGFYLSDSQCVEDCPLGTFAFEVTQECIACPTSCSQCTNSTHCTVCIPNSTYLDTSSNACLEYCPSGSYGEDSTGQCQPCQSKCMTCLGSADGCLVCADDYLLVKLQNAEFDCLQACPSEYYSDNGVCYPCIFPCAECESAVACITCAPGTYFHENSSSCLLNCPMGTYYLTEPTPTCQTCNDPCETCLNQTTCISCQGDLMLLSGACYESCPEKYYADASGVCNRCYGMCKTCSSKYYCQTCHTGFAYDGFCYSACPPGTYASEQTRKCEPCNDPCLECASSPDYCKRCQFNMFAYKGECTEECPVGTYQSGDVCLPCQFPCTDCPDQFSCQECIGGYLLYMNASCIENVQKCPNDLYKKDSKQCVPFTWCPDTYYKDEVFKTCSATCSRQKYVNNEERSCGDSCEAGQWVDEGMVCTNWKDKLPSSLMGMTVISFIKSSEMHIVVFFNQTASWDESSSSIFVLYNEDLSRRRMLASSTLRYKIGEEENEEKDLTLEIMSMPHSVGVQLPAHYVHSEQTQYPLQTPEVSVRLPDFQTYSYEDVYTGSILKQFSEGIGWFIILFSLFFLFMNRLSDVYILWDTAQLLYLLLFLHIQYPPNLNQFLGGMSNTHFLFVPSLFESLVSDTRLKSDLPFYAYSFDCSFLRTAGSPILLILIVVIIFLLLKLFELLHSKVEAVKQKFNNYPKIKQYLFRGLLRFRWHHASDTFFLSYDIIVLFSIAEMVKISQNPNNAGSNVVAALFLLVYLIFPCFVGYKLNKHYDNISRGKLVANLQCFYRGIDKSNKFGVFLILLRYFRKIVYCVIIGLFSMEPMFALPILMFTSVVLGLFIFINKPFKKKLSNMITIATQAILVIVFVIVALINFNAQQFSSSVKIALGWVCCLLLVVLLFGLVFEVFCKTMFYLQPQKHKVEGQALLEKGQQYSEEFLRQKAGEFFDFIFPKLKDQLNLDDSDDELLSYEEGDSQNSQNNDIREKNWGIDSDSERRSDQFRHYGGDSESETETAKAGKKAPPPNYLIRCVKELN